MSSGESRLYGQTYKDVLRKQTQISTLKQTEKKVKMNDTIADKGDLEVDNLEVM